MLEPKSKDAGGDGATATAKTTKKSTKKPARKK